MKKTILIIILFISGFLVGAYLLNKKHNSTYTEPTYKIGNETGKPLDPLPVEAGKDKG